jgi:hypothetical protein
MNDDIRLGWQDRIAFVVLFVCIGAILYVGITSSMARWLLVAITAVCTVFMFLYGGAILLQWIYPPNCAPVDGRQSGAASPAIGSVPNTAAETDGTHDDRKTK